ncbi:hypothetical protein Syun_025011 [Stephania yunnanensis]|uniref:Uncharacterized protein n=1 Tax=Stephania yunnanensis TaxID=152371 RepID=A0AAP0HVE5_9MAGN
MKLIVFVIFLCFFRLVCFLERPPAPHGGLFFGCCGGEGPWKKQDIAIKISRKLERSMKKEEILATQFSS